MILYRVLQLPPCQPPGGPEFDLEGASAEALRNPLKHFPTLDKKVVKTLMNKERPECTEEGGDQEERADVKGILGKRCV